MKMWVRSWAQSLQSARVPPSSRSLTLQIITYLTKIAAVTVVIGCFRDQREVAYKSQLMGRVWTPWRRVRNKDQIDQVWGLPGKQGILLAHPKELNPKGKAIHIATYLCCFTWELQNAPVSGCTCCWSKGKHTKPPGVAPHHLPALAGLACMSRSFPLHAEVSRTWALPTKPSPGLIDPIRTSSLQHVSRDLLLCQCHMARKGEESHQTWDPCATSQKATSSPTAQRLLVARPACRVLAGTRFGPRGV